jgi:hypothetical protein
MKRALIGAYCSFKDVIHKVNNSALLVGVIQLFSNHLEYNNGSHHHCIYYNDE